MGFSKSEESGFIVAMQPIKKKAYTLLARRDHFTKELRRKLKEKGFLSNEIEPLLDELTARGFLDDASLARRFAARQKEKGYGPRVIAAKLKEKAGEMDVELEEDVEVVCNLIERRYAGKEPKKVIAALLRRGFSYGLIQNALSRIETDS